MKCASSFLGSIEQQRNSSEIETRVMSSLGTKRNKSCPSSTLFQRLFDPRQRLNHRRFEIGMIIEIVVVCVRDGPV